VPFTFSCALLARFADSCRPPDQFSSLLWIDTGKSQKGKGIIRCITIDLEEKIYHAVKADFSNKIN
jgi:hypothetical protein